MRMSFIFVYFSIDFVMKLYYNNIMETLNEILSNNLTKLRKFNNYTQADIASKLDYSDKTISKWETGEIVPSIENLIKLAKLYNLTLDEITSPLPEEHFYLKTKNFDKQNKIIITLLAILAVWIVATVFFVYTNILLGTNSWRVFIWAIPVSCIVALTFNKLWGKRIFTFIILSILIWSTITAIFLELIEYNLFATYFIGIPIQLSIILWSGLKKQPKIEKP